MGGPWEDYAPASAAPAGAGPAKSVPAASGPWDDYKPQVADQSPPPGKKMVPLSILPFSVAEDGDGFSFDSNAGVIGSIKRGLLLPGDVYTGKVAPTSTEGIGRAIDLATIAAPLSTASRAASGGAGLNSVARSPAAIPTADELRGAATAGYKNLKGMNVDFAPKSVNDMATGVKQGLNNDGLLSELAPTTHTILARLAEEQPAGAVAPLQGIIASRQALGRASRAIDPATRRPTQDAVAAKRAIESLDGFLEAPGASNVISGDAAAASPILKEANANYAAASRSEKINGIEAAAELRAAAANSGQNTSNAIRSRVATLLTNPKALQGFNPEEVAALREVAAGTPTRNAVRMVGNLLGGGGGLGAMVTGAVGGAAGGSMGGGIGVALGVGAPLLGMAAKAGENASTRSSLNKADTLIRKRSPLFQQNEAAAPLVEKYSVMKDAAARSSMLAGENGAIPDAAQAASPSSANAQPFEALGATDASDAGAKFVRAPGDNKDFARSIVAMAPKDRAEFSRGFQSELESAISQTDAPRNVVNQVFGHSAARQRVEIALGKQGASQFEAKMRKRYFTKAR